MEYDVETLAKELAKATDIPVDKAQRVLNVLGIEKLVRNHKTARQLVQDKNNLRALNLPLDRERALPDFTFANLGLVMHDIRASIIDVAK